MLIIFKIYHAISKQIRDTASQDQINYALLNMPHFIFSSKTVEHQINRFIGNHLPKTITIVITKLSYPPLTHFMAK